jgi:single-strand DNA-binding protein
MERLIFTGHLGREAELRRLPDGTPVVGFSVAVKRGWGDRERTVWYDCSWWGERAERCVAWLGKGRQVAIQGLPDARAWMPRDGSPEPRAGLECRVLDLDLLGGGSASAEAAPSPAPAPAPAGPAVDLKEDVAF